MSVVAKHKPRNGGCSASGSLRKGACHYDARKAGGSRPVASTSHSSRRRVPSARSSRSCERAAGGSPLAARALRQLGAARVAQLGVAVGRVEHPVDAHHPVLAGEHLLKVLEPALEGLGGVGRGGKGAVSGGLVVGGGKSCQEVDKGARVCPAQEREGSLEVHLADDRVAHAVVAAGPAKHGAAVGEAVVGEPGVVLARGGDECSMGAQGRTAFAMQRRRPPHSLPHG